MIFAEEAKVYATDKRQLAVDMRAAGAKIFFNYCTRGLQDKLESEADFDKVLRDDPMKLLERIRVLMHEPDKAEEPFTSLLNATANFINIRKMENESINDYVRRFKNMRNIFQSLIGVNFWTASPTISQNLKHSLIRRNKRSSRHQCSGSLKLGISCEPWIERSTGL